VKELDFKPSKSKKDFRKNYKLHDMAEFHGKNLLTQWGIEFSEFGEDKRYERVWEKGEDKPDLILNLKNQNVFLDWKGKHQSKWLVNERAIKSYERWSDKHKLPVIIAFLVFDEFNALKERRFAFLHFHNYIFSSDRQWDKNRTVEFNLELPEFNKANIIEYLRKFVNDEKS
jgi:hypothetical protein